MNLARKKMDWSSPDFCYTGSLDLLPPNPDRRAAYLARKQEVRAAK
jgi:hypothetical protein